MAIEFVSGLTKAEFYSMLSEKPHKLKVINVTDIRENKQRKGDYFFNVDFIVAATGQEMGVTYGIKKDRNYPDKWMIPSGSKLYPLIEYIHNRYNIPDEKVYLTQEDIHETLDDLEAVFTAKKEKAGKTLYYVLIPEKQTSNTKQ